MKKNIIRLSALLLAAAPLAACDDWTEPEAQDFTQRFPESYYENLRAYKASDHSITFGWFGGWDPKAATTGSSLMGIPDSVDLVANWASFYLTEEQKAEAKAVKAKKGTDVVVTLLLMDIGRTITPDEVTAGITGKDEIARAMRHYWGWSDDADAAEIEAAIRKYASAVVDVVLENEYTGLDLDYEPSYSDHLGNIVNDLPSQGDIYAGTTPAERTFWFVDECGRRLGPKSGSGKLLIVDGEVAKMPVGTIEYFDYYILQTYSLSYQSNLDTRLGAVISAFSGVLDEKTITNRTIVCENFEPEALWKNGGSTYVLPDGSTTNSLHGMATWQPYTGYRKGGFGAYQMQNDFKNDCYKYAALRNILYRKGKSVEILECYEPDFALMNEWYKQLFGESEGKDNKGLFPASCIFSTDLHSMGQFIQEGSRTMFETIVDVKKPAQDLFIDPLEGNFDGLNFLANQNMSVVNRKAMEGTILAHTDGGVPEVLIEVDDLTAYNVGYLIYFFWRACACSGYLLSVNPFNQPGVESYKKNMFALLGKPGYEGLTAELEAKLK